jgi:hypothetical protein
MWDDSVTISGIYYPVTGNETCQYGCEGGKCSPVRSNDSTALAILFSIISFGFIYLGTNLKGDNAALSWLFIPLGLIMMFVGIISVMAINVFSEGMSLMLIYTAYGILLTVIFLIAYFLIMLLWNLLKKADPYPSGGRK